MQILFLGAGKMGSAIASGMVKGRFTASKIHAFDVSATAAKNFTEQSSCSCSSKAAELADLVKAADTILIAVKPQYLAAAVQPIAPLLADKLILSIVAGASIARLKELSGAERIIRIMPNTPALVKRGCSAFAPSANCTSADKALAERILGTVGLVRELPENLLDAVTGLSGSGPAFVLDFIQALADGGVAAGLPRDVSLQFALQTVAGTAELVRQSQRHPIALRDDVTSPAGTTIRGVEVLAERAFSSAVIEAVRAAAERSAELGKKA